MKTALPLVMAFFAASAAGLPAAHAAGAYPGTPEMTRLVHHHADARFRQYYDAAMRARGHYVPPVDDSRRMARLKKNR
jgi:hypothetical protein